MGDITVARNSEIIPYLKEYGRDQKIFMTIGWRHKNPTTKDITMTPEQAIDYVEKNIHKYALAELDKRGPFLFLTFFTANDLW